MKLTDYIANFLAERGVTHAFGMSGGAAVHMFDSIDRHPAMSIVSMTHEQGAAMAADGYSRATGRVGVAVTTSGPGATTLPILIYSSVKRGITPDINALSTLIVLASILGTLAVTWLQRRGNTRT